VWVLGGRLPTAEDGHGDLGRSFASARGLAEHSLTPPRTHTPTSLPERAPQIGCNFIGDASRGSRANDLFGAKIRAVDPARIVIFGGNQWFGAAEMATVWTSLDGVGGARMST